MSENCNQSATRGSRSILRTMNAVHTSSLTAPHASLGLSDYTCNTPPRQVRSSLASSSGGSNGTMATRISGCARFEIDIRLNTTAFSSVGIASMLQLRVNGSNMLLHQTTGSVIDVLEYIASTWRLGPISKATRHASPVLMAFQITFSRAATRTVLAACRS